MKKNIISGFTSERCQVFFQTDDIKSIEHHAKNPDPAFEDEEAYLMIWLAHERYYEFSGSQRVSVWQQLSDSYFKEDDTS